jgi:hypothetical protein
MAISEIMETTIKANIRAICLDAHTDAGLYMVEALVSEEDARKLSIGKKEMIMNHPALKDGVSKQAQTSR